MSGNGSRTVGTSFASERPTTARPGARAAVTRASCAAAPGAILRAWSAPPPAIATTRGSVATTMASASPSASRPRAPPLASLVRLQQLPELGLVVVDQHRRDVPALDHRHQAGMRREEAIVGLLDVGRPDRSAILPFDQLGLEGARRHRHLVA